MYSKGHIESVHLMTFCFEVTCQLVEGAVQVSIVLVNHN